MKYQVINTANLPAILPTEEAAPLINRKPQTLRKWACLENGPISPIRINGRLGWKVSDLEALLNGTVSNGNIHHLNQDEAQQ